MAASLEPRPRFYHLSPTYVNIIPLIKLVWHILYSWWIALTRKLI